jgi:hypothetical protein
MSPKASELAGNDLVRAFLAGITAWEQPLVSTGSPETALVTGEVEAAVTRVRGAIRTQEGGGSDETEHLSSFALAQEDPVVEQFQVSIRRWEHSVELER